VSIEHYSIVVSEQDSGYSTPLSEPPVDSQYSQAEVPQTHQPHKQVNFAVLPGNLTVSRSNVVLSHLDSDIDMS